MAISDELREELRALARATREGTDLAAVFRGFDEEMRSFDELIEASVPRAHPVLETTLRLAGRTVHGPGAPFHLLTPIAYLAEARLWHGAFTSGGWMALFYFFEEHDVGIAAFACGDEVEHVRFTRLHVAPPARTFRAATRGQA